MNIDEIVQEKIDADADFQATLVDLSEEEKKASITAKKSEVLSQEFASLKEQADTKVKAEELANNYKIRAEKAEAEVKKKETVVPSNESKLTPKDIYALMNAKVEEEDIEQVADYAKFKKISIAEALKSTAVKSMLEESTEHRITAQATQIRGGTRGVAKVSGEDLLSKAEKTGEVPETDEGMQAIFKAKMARKLKN